ncbi:MAG: hypothetical protein IJC95_05560 [Clostridia bacterium]|nr:hypothetical protein [Oscillospiraceae bacterium]MBQ2773287.1 hypothetical protein [Clostridia bacterium]MBQ3056934.1 hypothetical protein [Clostridia bacterium]
MKKYIKLFLIFLIVLSFFVLTSCEAMRGIMGNDNDKIHTDSYEPVTGRFYLYEAADERITCTDTYFDIDGSKGNFFLKYYENGVLKKQGEFQKIITYTDRVGYWSDNLHFNIKCGDTYEHIGTYTESFDQINQFRIIDEYSGGKTEAKYYYSELPFVLGTYVREGAAYVEESPNINNPDYTVPTLENYTSELNGKYELDEDHYFYFISPRGYALQNGPYLNSYFQYFAPELDKPLEGFAHGITYKDSLAPPRLYLTYSCESSYYKSLEDTEKALMFGYTTFQDDDTMIDHYGSIDFSNGKLNSFTFEHLSRSWTEEEWDTYTKSSNYQLPDAVIYDYVGGTYKKSETSI